MNALKRLAGMLVQEERAIPLARPSWFKSLFLGAIGRAGALALAFVLAPLLFVAAAVTLAGIQPLAGVLLDILLVGIVREVSGERGKCRTGDALRGGGVQSGHRAAQQAGKRRCEHEGVLVDLHVN